MTTIVEFLTARLDEDQTAALATTPVPVPGRWKAARDKHAPDGAPLFLVQGEGEYEPGSEDYSGNSPVIAYSAEWQDKAEANLRHIARPDPARVLREVEAKRAIVAEHPQVEAGRVGPDDSHTGCRTCHADTHCGETEARGLCETIRYMAAVYAEHPDYDQSWSVS